MTGKKLPLAQELAWRDQIVEDTMKWARATAKHATAAEFAAYRQGLERGAVKMLSALSLHGFIRRE